MRFFLSLLLASLAPVVACGQRSSLPERLTDEAYWLLSTELSEDPGEFTHSENLVSNEALFAHTIRRLGRRGGVYIGVGPEQNFSYIAALRPALAFVLDIRRENRNLHLMYKALFEMSADRAEFVSRLFARERPGGLDAASTVQQLFAAYADARPAPGLFQDNVRLVRSRLVEVHGFPLTEGDRESIQRALHAFYTDGPDIHYGRSLRADAAGPSYRALMTATAGGQSRSFLATEEGFAFVKDLHARNLIVPVIGDFSGAHAMRRTGEYIRRHGGRLEAFYGSNVEVYLNRAKVAAFCRTLALLPYRGRTPFIDNKGMQTLRSKLRACASRAP